MARIFLAIPLSKEVQIKVNQVNTTNLDVEKIVWMKPENLHITIYFIGQASRENTPMIIERIKNILKDIVKNTNLKKPGEMLSLMRDEVVKTLHADTAGNRAKDGMDMTLCSLNRKTLELQYAAAYNPVYIVRNGELVQYPANKFPIGAFIGDKKAATVQSPEVRP